MHTIGYIYEILVYRKLNFLVPTHVVYPPPPLFFANIFGHVYVFVDLRLCLMSFACWKQLFPRKCKQRFGTTKDLIDLVVGGIVI